MRESAVGTKSRTIQVRITVQGVVQGVGFRPFLSRLARRLSLAGAVRNTVRGVTVEIDGPADRVAEFSAELLTDGPYAALIHSHETEAGSPAPDSEFHILSSDSDGIRDVWITPDFATCDDCRTELFDPANRRFRYPFNSCAVCGPRYSILERLPFDRENTVMRQFPLCAECEQEYADREDRRFHAQTLSCPRCGPHLELSGAGGTLLHENHAALEGAVQSLLCGEIVALQGLGGFQLLVDATQEAAVARLRGKKHRLEKPLAVLFENLRQLRDHCVPTPLEMEILQSPEAPIVLVEKRTPSSLSGALAPGNPNLGAMIPYTPLHHLLMSQLGRPVVATSGNLSGEPICISPEEARARLGGVADVFLCHDRPIVRPVDDSVVRVVAGERVCLRSARGFAPITIPLPGPRGITALATGAQMKNSAALVVADHVMLSQHIGELDHPLGAALLRSWAADAQRLYDFVPQLVAHDDHPDYASTRVAAELASDPGLLSSVQHHHAHVAACMLEHGWREPVLGLAWDGTGLGSDGTLWGGEFLLATPTEFERVAHFLPFPLPGGDVAVREPRRTALGVLFACGGGEPMHDFAARTFTAAESQVLRTMLAKSIQAPLTSSVGRLYDAVAALLDLRQTVSFEGQAAMELEFLAASETAGESYPYQIVPSSRSLVLDWRPMMLALLADLCAGVAKSQIAARFQRTLIEMAAATVREFPDRAVVLSGGCFQNRGLTEGLVAELRDSGRIVLLHTKIPPNDGGLAAGQAWIAIERKANVSGHSR